MPLAFNNEIMCHDTNVLAPFSCRLTSIGQLLLQVACPVRPPDTPCRQAGRGTIGVNKIATQRDVKPVALLTFDDEFVRLSNVGRVRRVSPGLRDHVDEQVPRPRLSYFG